MFGVKEKRPGDSMAVAIEERARVLSFSRAFVSARAPSGAGAVVTHSPAYAIVASVPARVLTATFTPDETAAHALYPPEKRLVPEALAAAFAPWTPPASRSLGESHTAS